MVSFYSVSWLNCVLVSLEQNSHRRPATESFWLNRQPSLLIMLHSIILIWIYVYVSEKINPSVSNFSIDGTYYQTQTINLVAVLDNTRKFLKPGWLHLAILIVQLELDSSYLNLKEIILLQKGPTVSQKLLTSIYQ